VVGRALARRSRFTAHVTVNDGPGSLNAGSCTTAGTTGECSVTLNSSSPGVTTLADDEERDEREPLQGQEPLAPR
jgi:hypothetical protein